MKPIQTIYLCDDDAGVRGAVSFLLRQLDFQVSAHASGPALLAAIDAAPKPVRGVFLLDVRMEPMPGPLLHDALIALGLGKRNPVVFLSGHGDIAAAVAAMAKGAFNFVEKPHTDEALVAVIRQALQIEEHWQAQGRRCDFLHSMWDSLAPQQRRVALLVAGGTTNKVIGSRLGIVDRTVEMTRARVFEKLGVDSSAQLATTFADMRSCGIDTAFDFDIASGADTVVGR
ncbi:MAG: response regulator [Rhodoferax sp.]|nr:response regulator [Rhodoferax sp.]